LAQGGSLVFVSSLSHYVSYPSASVYAASKDGLASYARSLAVALKERDIQVLTVYPGPTRTAHARRYSPDNSREAKRMSPAELAERVFIAVQHRQRTLIPGPGNQFFAVLGRLFPRLTELVMKRTLLDRL
jgi:short-subunit dehydrogenase